MKKFIGRNQELSKLRQYNCHGSGVLIAIRGRRRVGKSRLVEEFAKDKSFMKFSGLAPDKETSAQDQRRHFATALVENGMTQPDDSDWDNLFRHLAKNLPKGRLVVLFDEISWMAKGDDTFLPKLKDAWDNHFKQRAGLIFIVCGSVSSWIEKNILSSTAFFGRVNEIITLHPLSLSESLELLDVQGFKGSSFDKLMTLSVTGGIPWYLEQFLKGQTADAHIKRLCFTEEGLLVNEYERIFNDLFGVRAETYKKIVGALAEGAQEYQSISEKAGYDSSGALTGYLEDLEVSGFIKKDKSWSLKTGKVSKVVQYRLSDNYLRFYLKYIQPNLDKIELGHFGQTALTDLKGFSSIFGLQFENLILANRPLLYDALGIQRQNIVVDNPYFQRAGKTQAGCQIDYMIQTEFNTLFVFEFKLSRKVIRSSVIDEVKEKIKRIKLPRGMTCIPVLVFFGDLSDSLEESDYFFKMIDMAAFFTTH